MPDERPTISRSTSPLALRKRVWSAGRLLVLVMALSITFAVFFLTAIRVANLAREVKVPDLRRHSVAEANTMLGDAGLVLKIDQRRPDSQVPADQVMSQEPAPGSILRRQRAVKVRVSDGQQDPVVPSVVGQAERTAELVLAQDKIEIADRAEVQMTGVSAGTVVAQDPAAANQSAKVTLLINRAEAGESYVMPDVIGTVGARVVDILRRHGFRVTVSGEVPYPGLAPGVVVKQNPQAGFQIGYGNAVVLEVSR